MLRTILAAGAQRTDAFDIVRYHVDAFIDA
jgi:hypothetical protein